MYAKWQHLRHALFMSQEVRCGIQRQAYFLLYLTG